MAKVSRKKFQECLRVLKGVCRDPKRPIAMQFRAAELIAAIYGVEIPGETKRDQRAVKELVTQRADEKKIQAEVRESVLRRTTADAEREARAFLTKVSTVKKEEEEKDTKETENE
jgi:hypothetical protein